MSDMPEQPKTKELPAVPDWAIELTKSMKEGFRVTNANIETVSNDLGIVKQRVEILEAERTKLSGGVRGLSMSDAGQNQEISNLATQVAELATKTDAQTAILQQLVKLTEKPVVKLVATALGTAILTYLSAKGLK